MLKIASFIVNKRSGFLVLFFVACIYSVLMIPKVEVINELTDYLPETTQTRQGLDLMDEEFTTFGSAQILVANITYDRALELAEELEAVNGISAVSFYDREDDDYEDEVLEDYYQDASALFTLTFEEEEEAQLSQTAIAQVRALLGEYDTYVYTTVDRDEAADLEQDMRLILAIVLVIILLVLLFTSGTYAEILIFLLVFLVAAILNMGTNYWFGTVSFVTNAVGTVLQLGLSIDYAIILLKRFMEERERYDIKEAITIALSKAIPEISSSSLTTVSGMVALMLMQFQIGMDLGRVLTKAILMSLLTVFLLMPALIMLFAKALERTVHPSFVPDISRWGRLIVKTRFVVLPLFLVCMAAACFCASQCHYIYDINSVESAKKNEFLASKERIEQTFEVTNAMAVIVPKGDYTKEAAMISEMEQLEPVGTVTGMSNIEVDDDGRYVLVDRLNPREFAEVADLELDMVQMLYRLYAVDQKQYRAFLKSLDSYRIPIIDMVDFIYGQKESGGLDLDDELSEDIDDLYDAVCDARKQLESDAYSRVVFELKGAVEGDETFRSIDQIQAIADQYYDGALVVGDATSNYDLSQSFLTDNIKISVLTALFVGIILLFTFQSASVPLMLLATIQSSIWINFSMPYLTGTTMFFLSYLIVSSIQMGATIDYAIVITSRYLELRKKMESKKEAVICALNQAFPTVVTSGTILTCAGFVVGNLTGNPTIASLGVTLGRGALCSVILVMTVLPQILLVFDPLIDRMAFGKGTVTKAAAACLIVAMGIGAGGFAGPTAVAYAQEQIVIRTEDEFAEFARHCSQETYSDGKTVMLEADLDLTEMEFAPVPLFCGTFEGNNHTIRGVRLGSSGADLGLFRYLDEDAVIRNLHVEGTLAPSGKPKQVGGIVGVNRGLLEHCSFSGMAAGEEAVGGIAGINEETGRLHACRNLAVVSGTRMAGGIAGRNDGWIEACENLGEVNPVPASEDDDEDNDTLSLDRDTLKTTLSEEKITDTGGIAGYSEGELRDCTNEGIVGCERTGYYVGGIVGRQNGRLIGCENYGAVTGRRYVGGIAGQLEPKLEIEYDTDVLDELEEQFERLSDIKDDLSRTMDDTSDKTVDHMDGIRDTMKAIRRITEDFRGDQTGKRDRFRSSADFHLDEIEARLDDLELDLGSRFAQNAMSRIRRNVTRSKAILKELGGEKTGTGADLPEWALPEVTLPDATPANPERAEITLPGDCSSMDDWILDEDWTWEDWISNGGLDETGDIGAVTAALQHQHALLTELSGIAGSILDDMEIILFDGTEGVEDGMQEFQDDMDSIRQEAKDLSHLVRDYMDQFLTDSDTFGDSLSEQMDALSDFSDRLSDDLKAGRDASRADRDWLDMLLDEMDQTLSDGRDRAERERDRLLDEEDWFEDVSDAFSEEDAARNEAGLILRCTNKGVIFAESECGGIVGSIGLKELEDLRDRIAIEGDRSLNLLRRVQAVITQCRNDGTTTARNDYVGGIVGKMDWGLVSACESYGDVESSDGDYAGGIAGSSSHMIRGSFSKCQIKGGDYIGGIVGFGTLLYENHAMASVVSEEGAWLGNIAGSFDDEDGEIVGNYYVENGLGAVDGVSYQEEATAVTYPELLMLPGIPEEFHHLTVTFVYDGTVVERLTCSYGDSISEGQIPEVPQEQGCYAQWAETEFPAVYDNLRIEAVITPWITTLASDDNLKPQLLAEGQFDQDARLVMQDTIAPTDVPAGYRAVRCYTYAVCGQDAAPYEETITLRVRAENKRMRVGLYADGQVKLLESRRDGDYLVASAPGSGTLVVVKAGMGAWIGLAMALLGLLAAAGWYFYRRIRQKNARCRTSDPEEYKQ